MNIGISLALKSIVGVVSSLISLFRSGDAGGTYDASASRFNRQTYNMPATEAASAGDPIGLMMPVQSPEEIINLLVWTDGFSDTTAWTGSATVTANTHNDSGVGNVDGPSPVADTLNTTVSGQGKAQLFTCAADTAYRTAAVDLQQGTATQSFIQLEYTSGNTYRAAISWSAGVPSLTPEASATVSDIGAELQASGIYRVWVRGANDGRTSCTFSIRPASSTTTGTVIASRAQVNDGDTMLAYQPNAGCLGGSNRRSGGANQFTWSQDVANPAWTKTSTTAADDGTITATAALAAHRLQNPSIVTVASTQYTAWFDLVRTNHDFFQIFINSTAGAGYVNFNINALTKSESTATGTITDNGDGSVRISITYTSGAVTTDYPVLCFITSLAAARGENWTPVGTETVRIVRAFRGFGSSVGTYTRNMGVLGGLITNVPLYQTTSGNRPSLARFPKTGIRNRVAWSEDFNQWTKTNVTVASGQANPIDGALTARRMTATAAALARVEIATNVDGTGVLGFYAKYVSSQWIWCGIPKASGAAWFDIQNGAVGLVNSGVSSATITAVTGQPGWYYIELTGTSWTGTSLVPIGLTSSNGGTTATNATAVDLFGYSAESGSTRGAYQKTAGFFDITESGVGYNYLPLYDGTSDFMTLGMQSWGTTQLQAAAQYAFTIFFVFRTVSASGGGIISQNNGASAAAQMFSLFVGSSTGAIGLNARGTAATAWGSDNRDGVFHCGALRWNGTSFDQILDNGSLTAVTWAGGSLAATAIDIAVGMQRVSTAASPFPGHLGVAFIDRACTDAEMQSAVRSLNATYRAGL